MEKVGCYISLHWIGLLKNSKTKRRKMGIFCYCPGSNWGPSVCKTDVITTTPQQLVYSMVFVIYINKFIYCPICIFYGLHLDTSTFLFLYFFTWTFFFFFLVFSNLTSYWTFWLYFSYIIIIIVFILKSLKVKINKHQWKLIEIDKSRANLVQIKLENRIKECSRFYMSMSIKGPGWWWVNRNSNQRSREKWANEANEQRLHENSKTCKMCSLEWL